MTEDGYNKFTGFSNLPYNIISNLILNDEEIWKLLNFPTNDALAQPNLTLAQKGALIYKGQEDSTLFRVFTTPFVDDAFEARQTHLHIYPVKVYPENYVMGVVDFAIDIICHNKIAILSNASNRLDVMFEHIMKALNGSDIESVGTLYFNADRQHSGSVSKLMRVNNFYTGYRIIMSVNYANS